MSNGMQQARERHLLEFERSMREGGGCPVEADEYLNDSARELIFACRLEWGRAYIGRINEDRHDKRTTEEIVWEVAQGVPVYNFGACFVVPHRDAELMEAIKAFRLSPSVPAIDRISARVSELGGESLIWS